jgi:hypothetical protein
MGNGSYCNFSHRDNGEMKISKKNVGKRFSHSKMIVDNLQFSLQNSNKAAKNVKRK